MLCLPKSLDLIQRLRPAFTRPSFDRLVLLCVAAIIASGRRTVSHLLLGVGSLANGHFSSYHRLLSRRRWQPWRLGRILCLMVLEVLPAGGPVYLAVDDTTTEHRGKKVWGKGCHRDAVHSSRGCVVKKWGHKWVVISVLVPLPFCHRYWALPILCGLYHSPKDTDVLRHKTPVQIARGLLRQLIRWFPQHRLVVLGDAGFGSHELARFASHYQRHLTLIARMRADTNLFALPAPAWAPSSARVRRHAPRRAKSRPNSSRRRGSKPRSTHPRCRKGPKRPVPREAVQRALKQAPLPTATVAWYGHSQRQVQYYSDTAGWYRPTGFGYGVLVPIRWVYVKDLHKGREDYFYSTDPTLDPLAIIELFARRWAIEVTFQESREHLGLESPRCRTQNAVLRTTPALLGLFTLIGLWAWRRWQASPPRLLSTPCYTKAAPTFADALAAVRRELWSVVLLKHLLGSTLVTLLPTGAKNRLLDHLSHAA